MTRKADKVRGLDPGEKPPRTFHLAVMEGYRYAVKNGYHLEPCNGEAHSNPYIDNCMLCLGGAWGWRIVKDTPA